jgi:cellobiose-specific phosphotransferase system component IIC
MLQGILIAAIQLVVAFIIWFCFMCFYRKEAKKMNEKLQAMKR